MTSWLVSSHCRRTGFLRRSLHLPAPTPIVLAFYTGLVRSDEHSNPFSCVDDAERSVFRLLYFINNTRYCGVCTTSVESRDNEDLCRRGIILSYLKTYRSLSNMSAFLSCSWFFVWNFQAYLEFHRIVEVDCGKEYHVGCFPCTNCGEVVSDVPARENLRRKSYLDEKGLEHHLNKVQVSYLLNQLFFLTIPERLL